MYSRLTYIILLLTLLLANPAVANMEFDGNASYSFNDNVSNAVSDNDIFEDSLVTANFNAAKLWIPGAGKSLLLSGHLGAEKYNDSTGLDRYSYGASLAYIQRLGLGAYAARIKPVFGPSTATSTPTCATACCIAPVSAWKNVSPRN